MGVHPAGRNGDGGRVQTICNFSEYRPAVVKKTFVGVFNYFR